jgi:hypothetical protein
VPKIDVWTIRPTETFAAPYRYCHPVLPGGAIEIRLAAMDTARQFSAAAQATALIKRYCTGDRDSADPDERDPKPFPPVGGRTVDLSPEKGGEELIRVSATIWAAQADENASDRYDPDQVIALVWGTPDFWMDCTTFINNLTERWRGSFEKKGTPTTVVSSEPVSPKQGSTPSISSEPTLSGSPTIEQAA